MSLVKVKVSRELIEKYTTTGTVIAPRGLFVEKGIIGEHRLVDVRCEAETVVFDFLVEDGREMHREHRVIVFKEMPVEDAPVADAGAPRYPVDPVEGESAEDLKQSFFEVVGGLIRRRKKETTE